MSASPRDREIVHRDAHGRDVAVTIGMGGMLDDITSLGHTLPAAPAAASDSDSE